MTMDQRWIAFVDVDDRNGALTATAESFSTRGVSFDAVTALDVHGGGGALAFSFAATERLARALARTLERLALVRRVRLVAAGDPSVRALAHLAGRLEEDAAAELAASGVEWAVLDGATVLAGPLSVVDDAVARLRARGVEGFTRTVVRDVKP